MAHERLKELWEPPPGIHSFLGTVDHKKIGMRYLVTALAFLGVGGIEAVLMRLQLSGAERATLSPEAFNQVMSLHGITMIFWYAAPILSGFGNYLIPLMIGSRDMAFPRLNAFSYWTFLLSGLFLYVSVPLGQAPNAGWFAYAPLNETRYTPGLGQDFYALALIFLTVSTTVGAINFVMTILRHRAPGMTLMKMPLMTYSTGTTSMLVVLSLPALTAACVCLELDRRYGTHFFDTSRGGDPLLWQHLFWFFGHPWVYVVFLPATGMVSMMLPAWARRPVVGYPWIVASTIGTGVVGMAVWVHHMFAAGGMSHGTMTFFGTASMVISVFSTIQIFAWLATLWHGRPVRSVSLMFILGFIATFVIGGLTGVMGALIPFDWQITDTYFVVAHLHYVLIGANLFPVLAAFYFWLPKMTGRLMSERLGRWSFWLSFVGFHVGFFPMHLSGLLGMPRRVYTYLPGDDLTALNVVTTIGALVLATGVALSIINFIVSSRRGSLAGKNPWNAEGLEWSVESPPKDWNFFRLPTVTSRSPMWDEHDEMEDPDDERLLDGGRWTLTTTVKDARPVAIAQMPEDTVLPLALALTLTCVFVALVLQHPGIAAVFLVGVLALTGAWLWPRPEKRAA